MTAREIVVIVVNYNGRDVTPQCISSIRQLQDRSVRLLIVDNASSDGIEDYLHETDREHVLSLGENLGFAGGVAKGLRWALARQETAAVAVLNSDIAVDRSFGFLMRQVADGTRPSALYGPVLLEPDGTVQNAGQVWNSRTGMVSTLGVGKNSKTVMALPDLILPSNMFLCGAAFVAPAGVFAAVPFDAELFLMSEDLDYGMATRAAGIPSILVHSVTVTHAGSATLRKHRQLYIYYLWRNGPLMTARYASRLDLMFRVALTPWQALRHAVYLARRRELSSMGALVRGVTLGMRRALRPPIRDA